MQLTIVIIEGDEPGHRAVQCLPVHYPPSGVHDGARDVQRTAATLKAAATHGRLAACYIKMELIATIAAWRMPRIYIYVYIYIYIQCAMNVLM